MSNSQEQRKFKYGAASLLRELGAIVDENNTNYWLLETKVGELRLRIDTSQNEGPGTVFTRFADHKRASAQVCCNPHSGKWNFYYFINWTAEDALKHLKFRLRLVL